MALKKGAPGKGGQVRADSFSYYGVPSGTKSSFGAWLAGPVYWAQAHEHTKAAPGTKPCLDWMTDGALRCPRCRPHTVPTWIGWVPLYREEDHKPILVLIHESAMDLVAGLSYPVRVLVGRCDDTSSVFVKRAESQIAFKTENDQRKCPVDLTANLLTMWALPQLDEWLMLQRHEARSEAPVKSDGEPFGPMTAAAAQKYAAPADDGGPSAETFDAVRERLRNRAADLKPSVNGKHKPKG